MRVVAGRGGSDHDRGRRAAGELEGDVLAVLWSAGSALTPGEVHEALGADLAYTTVSTILNRLLDKGLVERTKAGRAHAYTAVAAESDVVSAGFRSGVTPATTERRCSKVSSRACHPTTRHSCVRCWTRPVELAAGPGPDMRIAIALPFVLAVESPRSPFPGSLEVSGSRPARPGC